MNNQIFFIKLWLQLFKVKSLNGATNFIVFSNSMVSVGKKYKNKFLINIYVVYLLPMDEEITSQLFG